MEREYDATPHGLLEAHRFYRERYRQLLAVEGNVTMKAFRILLNFRDELIPFNDYIDFYTELFEAKQGSQSGEAIPLYQAFKTEDFQTPGSLAAAVKVLNDKMGTVY